MIGMDCSHPDIEEFLTLKQNDVDIQSANLSILFDDEFMKCVLDNLEYRLHFEMEDGTILEKNIDARHFFYKFAKVQHEFAEPGALFIDRIREHNLLSGYPEDIYKIDICNPCVSGRTLILTQYGYKKIEDLVGEKVKIWNGYEWSEVTPKVTGTNQQMKLVKLSNGMELECTNYHKFVMRDSKTRKRAEELVVGDKLAKWEYPVIEGSHELREAYTQGFYSGDGTKDSNQICLYGEKIKLMPYLDVVSFNDQPNQERVSVRISNSNYSKTFVPQNQYDIKSRLDWLAGFIDSDGCLNDVGGSIAVSSIDREFLVRVQLMLSTLGCHSSINIMHKEETRQLPLNDGTDNTKEYLCQTSYRLVISAYNVLGLVKLGLVTHRVTLIADPNRNAGRFISVIEVIDLPIEPVVYCFNEPKNHTGIFNGIMTGQCAEYMGNKYNSCNLMSINLYNMVTAPFTKEACINVHKLMSTVDDAIIFLDEILDYGRDMQPLEANKLCIDDWRAIGLGVFGLADMLIALGIEYGSAESIDIVRNIQKTILHTALFKSSNLAKEKGKFKLYDWEYIKKSPIIINLQTEDPLLYDTIKNNGLRNGSLLAIAPTGTIATMAGLSGGVEPLFRLSYERTTHAMEKTGETFHVLAKSVSDFMKFNNISGSPYDYVATYPFLIESEKIDPYDRLRVQGTMQEYVDNAISSTINLDENVSISDIFNIYVNAWRMGCKGITVFRNNCARTSILKSGDENKESDTQNVLDTISPMVAKDFERLPSSRYHMQTSCVPNLYVHVASKDGKPLEIFTSSEHGCKSNLGTITRLVSLALRSGIKVDRIIEELSSNVCPACTANNSKNKSCGHAIAMSLQKEYDILAQKEGEPAIDVELNKSTEKHKYMQCPECGEYTLVPTGKCVSCFNCNYTKCD